MKGAFFILRTIAAPILAFAVYVIIATIAGAAIAWMYRDWTFGSGLIRFVLYSVALVMGAGVGIVAAKAACDALLKSYSGKAVCILFVSVCVVFLADLFFYRARFERDWIPQIAQSLLSAAASIVLFWKGESVFEKPLQKQIASPDVQFAAAAELIARMGDVAELHPGMFLDESLLPAPKDTMKLACKIAWAGAKTQKQKDLVFLAWSMIAHFQPNAKAANLSVENVSPNAEEMSAKLEAANAVFAQCAREKAENDAEFLGFIKQIDGKP